MIAVRLFLAYACSAVNTPRLVPLIGMVVYELHDRRLIPLIRFKHIGQHIVEPPALFVS